MNPHAKITIKQFVNVSIDVAKTELPAETTTIIIVLHNGVAAIGSNGDDSVILATLVGILKSFYAKEQRAAKETDLKRN